MSRQKYCGQSWPHGGPSIKQRAIRAHLRWHRKDETCREVYDLLLDYSTSELPGDVAHGSAITCRPAPCARGTSRTIRAPFDSCASHIRMSLSGSCRSTRSSLPLRSLGTSDDEQHQGHLVARRAVL